MIQGSSSAATQMALRLSSTIKWCITGTPLGSGKLTDLSALLAFLGQSPLHTSEAWRRLVGDGSSPYSQRVLRVACAPLFLRRTKAAVEAELQLPPQSETIRFLLFNCVEVNLIS